MPRRVADVSDAIPADAASDDLPAARPAATVVIVRDHHDELEVLLLERSSVGAFAGMWVFPGGRVDDDDPGHDELTRAMSAAVREAREEVGLTVDPAALVTLSHWTPPAVAPKRFTTWFFVAPWAGDEVIIDAHEIVDARWVTPSDALAENLPMAPPTHVTLDTLDRGGTFDGVRRLIEQRGVERYVTSPADIEGSLVLLWENDAGYESGDASLPGGRHRMTLSKEGPAIYERSFGEGE